MANSVTYLHLYEDDQVHVNPLLGSPKGGVLIAPWGQAMRPELILTASPEQLLDLGRQLCQVAEGMIRDRDDEEVSLTPDGLAALEAYQEAAKLSGLHQFGQRLRSL